MNSTSIDSPISRRTLERITRPFQIYFLLSMALLGSSLFIVGVVSGGLSWLERTTMPNATLMLLLGIGGFAFFFPWFLCLYCCRILLQAVRALEEKVEGLGHEA
jgi:hypothetical protein